MRLLLIYCLVSTALILGATNTSNKIKYSQDNLTDINSKKREASNHLEKIAKDIAKADKDIDYIDIKINELSESQDKIEEQYSDLKKELELSTKDFKNTSIDLQVKRKKFISLLSEQFAITFAMQKSHEPTRKSILSLEVYKAYKKQNIKMLESLKEDIGKLKTKKQQKLLLRNETRKKIKKIIDKRENYTQKKLAKKKLLKKLSADEEKYSAKLAKISDRQDSLNSTLAKLNILHNNEVIEAREIAAARKKAIHLEKERKREIRKEKEFALAKAKKAEKAIKLAKTIEAKNAAKLAAKRAEEKVAAVKKRSYKQSERVRTVNSSYKKSKTYAYRGGKTISPIPGARVIKKFGTYIDPVYKIKIFNESITLKAPSSDANVKNVLNGKVVFAGKSSMLGKVVVVAHGGKMHTIYAGLTKIAPNIKKGRKIKKGYVVGKVKSKLLFQATKNSKHINPLKLISI